MKPINVITKALCRVNETFGPGKEILVTCSVNFQRSLNGMVSRCKIINVFFLDERWLMGFRSLT